MAQEPNPEVVFTQRREGLVSQLRRKGEVSDPAILAAFAAVPRHRFVPANQLNQAYHDRALPLTEGQTISQPTMVGIMLQALDCQSGDRALEVGAGCGYAAALLAQLVAHVDAVELRETLVKLARTNLATVHIDNVTLHHQDGQHGIPGPFQRILVSAGAPAVSPRLLDELAPGGRIAIPVDDGQGQVLRIGSRAADGTMSWETGVRCLFVPLVTNH